ncbi:serine/threonine-protein kinase [Paenibacillus taiwanensis]|uniref:serine/threonine-protein kinase n=1 Tax=Paenibacillus taiwanensis TaxID=401638 RepID=UPI0003F61935|nr:serine/threonine-protein kinase [Paenibacillus taiwanensis]
MRVPSRLQEGSLLAQRYRIMKLIGTGGMSYVYLARDERLMGKQWAIKESIPLRHNQYPLAREAQWLTELKHPHLPLIVDFFPPHDECSHAYLVMEYIEGETIAERMIQKSFSFLETMEYSIKLCAAMGYLHQHVPPIIYRDLKPSNVMITAQGGVKLIDFGIARQMREDAYADTIKLGTVGFAAPEQYAGKQSDARTDLYAVGALMAYMLTDGRWYGMSDFKGGVLRSDVPEQFASVLLRLLDNNPENRYQSAEQLRDVLQEYTKRNDNALLTSDFSAVPTDSSGKRMQLSRGEVFALMGSGDGAGTTHTAIMIAHALSNWLKVQVAYMDYSNEIHSSSVVDPIIQAVEGQSSGRDIDKPFKWRGVTYLSLPQLKEKHEGHILPHLQTEYRYVVLDLGSVHAHTGMDEFMRATFSLLVGSAAIWRQQETTAAVNIFASRKYSYWCYGVPHYDDADLLKHPAQQASQQVISIPTCADPFSGNEDVWKWLQSWTGINRHKRRRFAWPKWLIPTRKL